MYQAGERRGVGGHNRAPIIRPKQQSQTLGRAVVMMMTVVIRPRPAGTKNCRVVYLYINLLCIAFRIIIYIYSVMVLAFIADQ